MGRGRKPTTLLQKAIKALGSGVQDELDAMAASDLRLEIVRAEERVAEIEDERAGDEKLAGAREIAKDLGGGYKDAIKSQRAKARYASHLLESKPDTAAPQARKR